MEHFISTGPIVAGIALLGVGLIAGYLLGRRLLVKDLKEFQAMVAANMVAGDVVNLPAEVHLTRGAGGPVDSEAWRDSIL